MQGKIQLNIFRRKGLHSSTSLNVTTTPHSHRKSYDANRNVGLSDYESPESCGCFAPHGEKTCTSFHCNTASDELGSPMIEQETHKHSLFLFFFLFENFNALFLLE